MFRRTKTAMSIHTDPLKGSLFALAAFAAFATHDALIKYLGGAYAPFQIVFFSVLFGFPLVTLMLMRDAEGGALKPAHPWWVALRTLSVVITATTAFYAFSVLPLAEVYAIVFAMPLLITLLAVPILGERVGLRRGLAVLVGFGGVFIVLQPGQTALELGHAAALVAAIGGSFASVIVRKIGRDEKPVVLILYPMMANVIVMGAAMPFVYVPMPGSDLLAVAAIAALALMATYLLIAAYKAAPAATVAPMQYSQIIWATLFASLFFGEAVAVTTLIGAAVIIASGLYILIREDRGGNSANRPVLRTRSRTASPAAPRVAPFLPESQRGPRPASATE